MKIVAPTRIDQETFERLNKREKAFVFFLYQKRYTRQQIMDKLFIDNERTFRRLQKRIRNVISVRMSESQEKKLNSIWELL